MSQHTNLLSSTDILIEFDRNSDCPVVIKFWVAVLNMHELQAYIADMTPTPLRTFGRAMEYIEPPKTTTIRIVARPYHRATSGTLSGAI